MTATTGQRHPRIVIVGAGMSGIATAHVLKQAGFTDFTILESRRLTSGCSKGTSTNHGQPRTNTSHHPEKLLRDDDEYDGP